MSEWCLSHPYLTFTIILAIIFIIGDLIGEAIDNKNKKESNK